MRTTSALCAISRRAGGIAALIVMIAGTAAGQYLRGVNVSQAEWGDPLNLTEGPGNYAYATAPTFNYFAARALPFIRLQVKWERLQPTLGGPLNSDQLTYLQNDVAYAKAAGALVSIVPHNEARYATLESQVANYDSDACIVDNPCPGSPVLVTSDDLVDFWVKMSNVFVNDPTVIAYDLTNEPHDMGVANWSQIAQKVLTAIRANGDNKTIMIPGDGWSNATYWTTYNGAAPFITDPANNYYYEAHLYFDSDFSGSYAETYDQELAANPQLADVGATRLLPFANWCAANNVPCYLGEYGIPSNDARWLTVLNNFLNTLDIAKMPGTYWAAGELWATVPTCSCSLLSVQPSNNFTTDAEQLPTLLGHLPPNTVRTASAAASYGWSGDRYGSRHGIASIHRPRRGPGAIDRQHRERVPVPAVIRLSDANQLPDSVLRRGGGSRERSCSERYHHSRDGFAGGLLHRAHNLHSQLHGAGCAGGPDPARAPRWLLRLRRCVFLRCIQQPVCPLAHRLQWRQSLSAALRYGLRYGIRRRH
jgi:endoglucanase